MACRLILVRCLILLLSSKIFDFVASEELCADKNKQNLEMQLEIQRIKLENFNLKEQNEKLLSDKINCTALSEDSIYISDTLKRIQTDFEPFKNFMQNKLGKPFKETDSFKQDLTEKLADILKAIKTSGEATTTLAQKNSESLKQMQNNFESFKEFIQNKFAKSTNENDSLKADILKTVRTSVEAATKSKALAQQNSEKLAAIVKKINEVEKKFPIRRNCAEAGGTLGVVRFQPPNTNMEPFEASCNADNWMIVLRRMDGSVDFYRDWNTYKAGFGTASGEYFIGLENLHKVTTSGCYKLRIEMVDFKNKKTFVEHDKVVIGSEQEKYMLKELGKYSGNMVNELTSRISTKFSTYDRDHDERSNLNCAKTYKGAWWHKNCNIVQLTGLYYKTGSKEVYDGINWGNHYYPHKTANMMIRPC